MYTYLISYDLSKPETSQDYALLISFIKNVFVSWAKPQKSVWVVKTFMPITEVRDELRKRIDANDNLLVMDVTKSNWAAYNLSNNVVQWFNDNI